MKSIERVIQYIDYKGISKRAFEMDNGLSNGYLGKQLNRNADLGEGIDKLYSSFDQLSGESYSC